MSQKYTAHEVAKHNHEKDLWIVYNDGVYDITKFLHEHPGGEEVMLDLAGKDATKCFDDIGHTTEAIQLRETYKIGVVTGPFLAESVESGGDQEPSDETLIDTPTDNASNSSIRLLTAAGIAVYGIIFYYFWFS